MPSIKTTTLDLAKHTQSGVWQKNIKSGILSQLAASDPEMKVGPTDIFTFTGTPKAELVGESAEKSNTNPNFGKVTTRTYKVQVTYRYSDEVLAEDDEYQLGLVNALVGAAATALSRALDLIAIHGVNPLTGTVSDQVSDYLDKANFVSTITKADADQPDTVLDNAAATLVGNGYTATGIAFDPVFANQLASVKNANGDRKFPELGFGFNFTSFQGLAAASSDTVSGRNELEAANTNDLAIMGDFSTFKWGIARQMPLETILYGDPDGNGDLKRTNEIAIRAESYLGFAFLDPKAFVLVKKAAPAAGGNQNAAVKAK